jgi:lipopolysaccharide/colanic/teichoic acid biosynthesis glycosyltransferase
VRPISAFLAPSIGHGVYRRFGKRGLDVLLATVGLVCALPVLLLIAVVVRRSGPGPVLLRQARVGADGKVFSMIKFRTMSGTGGVGEPSWAGDNDDERVTRAGRRLRRTHLDELPQLWNVLMGDMSLVGPRPEQPEVDAFLGERIPLWTVRHSARPGLTGWAQICQGYVASVDASRVKLSYDLDYLDHYSPSFDFMILARTVCDVFRALRVR